MDFRGVGDGRPVVLEVGNCYSVGVMGCLCSQFHLPFMQDEAQSLLFNTVSCRIR